MNQNRCLLDSIGHGLEGQKLCLPACQFCVCLQQSERALHGEVTQQIFCMLGFFFSQQILFECINKL